MLRPVLLTLPILLLGCGFSNEYAPHSANVAVGTSEESIVATDCGLGNMVFDIDGSLWAPTNIRDEDRRGTPIGFTSDNDTGTLTLVSNHEATYRSSLGRAVTLVRLPGNLVTHDC